MKVNNFIVSWKHNNYTGLQGKKITKKIITPKSSTECLIVADGETYSALAICNPKDNYNKKIGRKLSFEKAVQQIESRDTRKELWEEFKKLSPKCLNCK